jgi:hypothetical protein
VHFVDEIDFVAPLCGRIAHVVPQFTHVFNAIVARAVDLNHIEAVSSGDLAAIIAHAAWRDGRAFHAIKRLR